MGNSSALTGISPRSSVIYPSLVDVNSYALATVPLDTVYIAKSSLPNAGLGAFAARPIARLSYFGPYGGYKHNNDLIHEASGYAWRVRMETA
ncbi:unnamed protein product [Rotaria sp. Silwood1]|nr:unnamed protein product [Rotaria sp. Silwood1]CAF1593085.1 unnamed protein product [Rotaria sp. Silwood1]